MSKTKNEPIDHRNLPTKLEALENSLMGTLSIIDDGLTEVDRFSKSLLNGEWSVIKRNLKTALTITRQFK